MRKLLNRKYSKIYLGLFVITTLFRYCIFVFNLDMVYFPINIIRGILFLFFYFSLVNKINIRISMFIMLTFISSEIAVFKLHLIYISLIFLARIIFFIHLYKTINWARIRKTTYLNTLNVSSLLILFGFLFYMLYLNNVDFHKNNIAFELASLFNEMIIVITCVLCFVNFLHKQTKRNKFLLIGTSFCVFSDILYNMQNLVTEGSTIMIITSSILYSSSFYLLVKSEETRVEGMV